MRKHKIKYEELKAIDLAINIYLIYCLFYCLKMIFDGCQNGVKLVYNYYISITKLNGKIQNKYKLANNHKSLQISKITVNKQKM